MGSSESKLPAEKLEKWSQLTFLSKSAILRCYDRFRDMNEMEIDNNVNEERVPIDVITKFFPELNANPFGARLCRVFSSASDKSSMNFEDFLDMVSVLSENAPIQTKADWAFRVFDHNEDGRITDYDVKEVVKKLCAPNEFNEDDMNRIVEHVLKEADSRDTDSIGPQEFRNIMGRSPDFGLNFTIRF